MLFRHNMSIAQQLIPIYNTNVHKNKSTVALMWIPVGAMTRHQHSTRAGTFNFDHLDWEIGKL